MAWQNIFNNPHWEYDNSPPDPGGALTALWQTGAAGIRINQRGDQIYMNCRHKTLRPNQDSVPNEINKTYWDNVINWVKLGQDIDGEAAFDYSGWSVSMNSTGNRVAIGSPYNDGNGDASGHTRIYEYDDITQEWVQLGNDIDGEVGADQNVHGIGDYSGYSVSMNADGDRVAIGARSNDLDTGHVRIYEWRQYTSNDAGSYHYESRAQDNTQPLPLIITEDFTTAPVVDQYYWTQVGQDIDGEANGDQSGYSVSINAEGNRVAIGAFLNDGNGVYSGHTRIYEYSDGTWSQLGQDIDGEATYDQSGYSVSMNADGDRVAIGARDPIISYNGPGYTRIYEYSVNTQEWVQLGQNIVGEAAGDYSGYSVSMNADGDRVAIGATSNDGNGSNSGHTRIYEFINGTWSQLGQDIDGEAIGDQSGYSVSINAEGNRVAIGATSNDGNGSNSGHVRIYEYNDVTQEWEQLVLDIDGEAAFDYSGYSVSMNAAGNRIAIGAYGNDGNGSNSGHTRIYELLI